MSQMQSATGHEKPVDNKPVGTVHEQCYSCEKRWKKFHGLEKFASVITSTSDFPSLKNPPLRRDYRSDESSAYAVMLTII